MRQSLFSVIFLFLSISLFAQEKEYKVRVNTVFGDMIIKLYNDTPNHRDNFIKNVKNGSYDGTIFHRVISSFMIQGGDPNSKGATADRSLGVENCEVLPAEIRRNHIHKKGAVASARLPDSVNPNRESSGCQFYIIQGYKHNDSQLDGMENENYKFPDVNRAYYKAVGGYPFLDFQYTIFGEVIEGLEVLDLISAMPTGAQVKDRPNTDIVMKLTMVE